MPVVHLKELSHPEVESLWLLIKPSRLPRGINSIILAAVYHPPKQPRTQALSTTRLAGGKTLVQAGHVSPRFWEITNFLHKGGGLSLFYRSSCRYQFDKVQSVCILTNSCNSNERQELVLQNQWVRCLCICILCGLHLRRRYARSIRSSIRTVVFQFRLGKTAKNY